MTLLFAGALSAAAAFASPTAGHAGILDFLFGPQQRPALPAHVSSYAEPSAPAWHGPNIQRPVSTGGGRFAAFCVRLCDGQHFPLDHQANATPVETCKAMCPASKTKVFYGGEIDRAATREGARYADLDTAYVYRDRLVPNCTCNGKDALGLATVDVNNDPTLRPGDIVATKAGLMAFAGKRTGGSAAFTPVGAGALSAATAKSARTRVSTRAPEAEAVVDEEPGIVVEKRSGVQAELRGQLDR